MNNKIIGFAILNKKITKSDVDIFKVGLNLKTLSHSLGNIYYWGIGDIEKCFVSKNKFSLSFPLTNSLLDRNIIVTINKNNIAIENDWLGSIPIFYNQQTRMVSTLINFLINDVSIDPEGFNNYLDFGYSVFEKTPIQDVKFMRYFSKLVISQKTIENHPKKDIVLNYLNRKSSAAEAVERVKACINSGEKQINGKIIIPTSGGFDSRLLNSLILDKKRINSFTYGVSLNQTDSSEVVKAREFSKILKTSWRSIHLGGFNKYYLDWFRLFGCSTHLHGMYHIEFYKKIKAILQDDQVSLLSGIINDAWSGNFELKTINSEKDVIELGYSHSLCIDSKNSLLKSNNRELKKYFTQNKSKLKDDRFRIIASMRIKLILLSYLMSLPDYFGFASWTPFLNLNNVSKILNIDKNQRQERKWLISYFRETGLYVEDDRLHYKSENTLDLDSLSHNPIENIDLEVLGKIITKKSLIEFHKQYDKLVRNQSKKKSARFNLMNFFEKPEIKWYNYIAVLKSIELTLKSHDY